MTNEMTELSAPDVQGDHGWEEDHHGDHVEQGQQRRLETERPEIRNGLVSIIGH